jgi:hypothetical protein
MLVIHRVGSNPMVEVLENPSLRARVVISFQDYYVILLASQDIVLQAQFVGKTALMGLLT